MPYAVNQDVIDEFKGLVVASSGTTVTSSQLTEWISQESNYIDGVISRRYVAPVSSGTYPEAYSILKRICIFRVSERVKNKIEVKSNVSQLDTEQKYTENFIRTPNHDLESIAKGNLILKDVPLISASGDSGSSCGPTCDVTTCHTFDVSEQQW